MVSFLYAVGGTCKRLRALVRASAYLYAEAPLFAVLPRFGMRTI